MGWEGVAVTLHLTTLPFHLHGPAVHADKAVVLAPRAIGDNFLDTFKKLRLSHARKGTVRSDLGERW